MPEAEAVKKRNDVFVARQPVFDRDQRVFGYELLFRTGATNSYDGNDADASTLDVISNSIVAIGLDELTGGKRGFINFTRNLLVNGVANLLPPELATVEILDDVPADEDVVNTCRKLKESGYQIALDDYTLHVGHPLLEMADIVKVSFQGTTPEGRKELLSRIRSYKAMALAEKVETHEEFQEALDTGYDYFQGYFFSRPLMRAGRQLSGSRLVYLQLMEAVNRPELSYDELEAVVKRDVTLTYRLLRFINSAWFGLRWEVKSIRHALVWLGPKEVRKWYALVALRNVASDKPGELFLRAMSRAKMAESIALKTEMKKQNGDLFLTGMFSLLDAMLDCPMEDVLDKLPLNEQIKMALMGMECPFRRVLDVITSYERGDWERFSKCAAELGLDEYSVPPLFAESIKWGTWAMQTASA